MNKKLLVLMLMLAISLSVVPTFAINVGTYKTETEYVEKEQSWSDKLLHKSGKLFWLILLVLFFLFVFKRIVEL